MRRYVVAYVFTDVPLQGNQVAVFEDAEGLTAELMQRVARELNLSETVFVLPATGDDHDAHIRIFTPVVELPFAGHPVLGTAFILGERLGLDTVRLRTANGVVPVALERRDGAVVFGVLPLTLPGLVTTVTFTFIAAWNEYVVALTLIQDDARKPLTVGISSYVTGYQQNWDQLFAASLIAIVPVVILFAAIEKHLVGGLTAGAVK